MHNPLLVALVAYAMRTGQNHNLGQFQQYILDLLSQLQKVEDLDEVGWYEDVQGNLSNQIPEEALFEMRSDFMNVLKQVNIEQLFPACAEIRLSLLVENAPQPTYPIKSVEGTFTVRWMDGTRIEYNCRPIRQGDGPLQGGTPMLSRMSDMFADQFIEAMVRPGLDTFHDQVAKPFDDEKFQSMMQVLDGFINSLEEDERDPYRQIKIRLEHQFGPGPDIQQVDQDKPLEFIEDGGGFK